jgi:hypothetical protein
LTLTPLIISWHTFGDQAAFAGVQAAAGGFNQVEIILEEKGNESPGTLRRPGWIRSGRIRETTAV